MLLQTPPPAVRFPARIDRPRASNTCRPRSLTLLKWLKANQVEFVLVGPVAEAIRGGAGSPGPARDRAGAVPAQLRAPVARAGRRPGPAASSMAARAAREPGCRRCSPLASHGERWMLAHRTALPRRRGTAERVARLPGAAVRGRPLRAGCRPDVDVASPEDIEHYAHVRRTGTPPEMRITRAASHKLETTVALCSGWAGRRYPESMPFAHGWRCSAPRAVCSCSRWSGSRPSTSVSSGTPTSPATCSSSTCRATAASIGLRTISCRCSTRTRTCSWRSCPLFVALLRGRPRVALAVAVIILGANATTEALKHAGNATAGPRLRRLPAARRARGRAAIPPRRCRSCSRRCSRRRTSAPRRGGLGAVARHRGGLLVRAAGLHYPSDVLGGFLVAATWTARGRGAARRRSNGRSVEPGGGAGLVPGGARRPRVLPSPRRRAGRDRRIAGRTRRRVRPLHQAFVFEAIAIGALSLALHRGDARRWAAS